MTTTIKIDTFRAGESNYNFLIFDDQTKDAIAVDPLDAPAMLKRARDLNLTIKFVLNTHGHPDHTEGNGEVMRATGAPLIAGEHEGIPGASQGLREGEEWRLGKIHLRILHTPGHTQGHICLIVNDQHFIAGDTVFYAGCGNCKFGGNPDDLFKTLQRIKTLPDHLILYCGHEYTQKNFDFGIVHDPSLKPLIEKRRIKAQAAIQQKQPPLFTLGEEKEHNILLRAPTVQVFKQLRELRNNF